MSTSNNKLDLRKFVLIAVFATISFIFMFFIEVPFPFIPVPFLKYNPSDIPALIIGFKLGILPGLLVIIFRTVLFLLSGKDPFFVSVFMNAFSSGVFVISAALIYKYNRSLLGAISGLLVGTAMSTVAMLPVNYAVIFLLFPNLVKHFVYFALFNISKGLLNSVFTVILYKKLSGILLKEKKIIKNKVQSSPKLDKQKIKLFKSLAMFVKNNPDMKIPPNLRKQWEETPGKMEKFEKIIKGKK
ncbi:ECF transporter S component [bacterium]|nr:ECF transporter S component [bacterium]